MRFQYWGRLKSFTRLDVKKMTRVLVSEGQLSFEVAVVPFVHRRGNDVPFTYLTENVRTTLPDVFHLRKSVNDGKDHGQGAAVQSEPARIGWPPPTNIQKIKLDSSKQNGAAPNKKSFNQFAAAADIWSAAEFRHFFFCLEKFKKTQNKLVKVIPLALPHQKK